MVELKLLPWTRPQGRDPTWQSHGSRGSLAEITIQLVYIVLWRLYAHCRIGKEKAQWENDRKDRIMFMSKVAMYAVKLQIAAASFA
jgi:hypothetical protein